MTIHEDLERGLGRVEGKQDAMKDRMEGLEDTVSEGFDKMSASLNAINNRLAAIEARENEQKGAWKVLIVISSLVSAIFTGAAVAWFRGILQ